MPQGAGAPMRRGTTSTTKSGICSKSVKVASLTFGLQSAASYVTWSWMYFLGGNQLKARWPTCCAALSVWHPLVYFLLIRVHIRHSQSVTAPLARAPTPVCVVALRSCDGLRMTLRSFCNVPLGGSDGPASAPRAANIRAPADKKRQFGGAVIVIDIPAVDRRDKARKGKSGTLNTNIPNSNVRLRDVTLCTHTSHTK